MSERLFHLTPKVPIWEFYSWGPVLFWRFSYFPAFKSKRNDFWKAWMSSAPCEVYFFMYAIRASTLVFIRQIPTPPWHFQKFDWKMAPFFPGTHNQHSEGDRVLLPFHLLCNCRDHCWNDPSKQKSRLSCCRNDLGIAHSTPPDLIAVSFTITVITTTKKPKCLFLLWPSTAP